jgi:hypothetical protein
VLLETENVLKIYTGGLVGTTEETYFKASGCLLEWNDQPCSCEICGFTDELAPWVSVDCSDVIGVANSAFDWCTQTYTGAFATYNQEFDESITCPESGTGSGNPSVPAPAPAPRPGQVSVSPVASSLAGSSPVAGFPAATSPGAMQSGSLENGQNEGGGNSGSYSRSFAFLTATGLATMISYVIGM